MAVRPRESTRWKTIWPDHRYELIDGVIDEMAAPSMDHQDIVGVLYDQLISCAMRQRDGCHPYLSPLDVQLDGDEQTMIQPDVMVCCDPKKAVGGRIVGAPDFVAEVISPSSRQRDRHLKLSKDKSAGVREYWLIDPDRRKVLVYLFSEEEDDDVALYSFDHSIPVGISDGKCEVCLAELLQSLG